MLGDVGQARTKARICRPDYWYNLKPHLAQNLQLAAGVLSVLFVALLYINLSKCIFLNYVYNVQSVSNYFETVISKLSEKCIFFKKKNGIKGINIKGKDIL